MMLRYQAHSEAGSPSYQRVEMYSVYGCFEQTLRQDPKSASFSKSSFTRTERSLPMVLGSSRLSTFSLLYNEQYFSDQPALCPRNVAQINIHLRFNLLALLVVSLLVEIKYKHFIQDAGQRLTERTASPLQESHLNTCHHTAREFHTTAYLSSTTFCL